MTSSLPRCAVGSPNSVPAGRHGARQRDELLQTPEPKIPTDWSRDGRLHRLFGLQSGDRLGYLDTAAGGRAAVAFAATPAEERNAKMSPDGRYIAYTFVQGGKSEVYVQPYPATGAKWQISRDGGQHPAWSARWQDAVLRVGDKKIMAVDVTSGRTGFRSARPRVAVDTRIEGRERTNQGSPFAVTPDGRVRREHCRRHGRADHGRPQLAGAAREVTHRKLSA